MHCVKCFCSNKVKQPFKQDLFEQAHCSYSGFLILHSHEMKLKVDFKCDWSAVDHVSDISQCLTSFRRYLNESKTVCKSSIRTFNHFVHPALLF